MTDEELEHRLTAVENRAQSNTHRLDELGKLTDAVNGMNTNNQVDHPATRNHKPEP